MKVLLGSDHGGYDLRQNIIQLLGEQSVETVDVGPESSDSVDYPDFVDEVCTTVGAGESDYGILICTTVLGL